MKKIKFTRKVISLVTALCFLINSGAFAIDLQNFDTQKGGMNLGAPILSDDIVPNKQLALAEIILQSYLQYISGKHISQSDFGIPSCLQLKNAFKKIHTDFPQNTTMNSELITANANVSPNADPIDVSLYHNRIQYIGGSIFTIPASIEKNGKRVDGKYMFSFKKEKNKKFPIVLFTEETYKKVKEYLANNQDKLPELNDEDSTARKLYIRHKESVDDVIAYAHSLNLAKKPVKNRFDYPEKTKKLLKHLQISVTTPDGLVPIENREFFLVPLNEKIRRKIRNTPKLMMIGYQSEPYEFLYYAHSSNKNVHVFVDPYHFKYLTDKRVTILPEDFAGKQNELTEKILEEIGAMLGFEAGGGVAGNLEFPVRNKIIVRYKDANDGKLGDEHIERTVVDLDDLMWEFPQRYTVYRDYAAGSGTGMEELALAQPQRGPSSDLIERYFKTAEGFIERVGDKYTDRSIGMAKYIIGVYREEIENTLESSDLKSVENRLKIYLSLSNKKEVTELLEILNNTGSTLLCPFNSILRKIRETLEYYIENGSVPDITLISGKTSLEAMLVKHRRLVNNMLLEYDASFYSKTGKLIAIMNDVYHFEETKERTATYEELREHYRKFMSLLAGMNKKDIDEAIRFITVVHLEINDPHSAVSKLREALIMKKNRDNFNSILLYTRNDQEKNKPKITKKNKEKAAIYFIAEEFDEKELEFLISVVEDLSLKHVLQSTTNSSVVGIVDRMKATLHNLGEKKTALNYPNKIPQKNEIGGLSTLKAALSLKRSFEHLPFDGFVAEDLEVKATLGSLSMKELRAIALLKMELQNSSVESKCFDARISELAFMKEVKPRNIPEISLERFRKIEDPLLIFSEAKELRKNLFSVPIRSGVSSDPEASTIKYRALVSFTSHEASIAVVTQEEGDDIEALSKYIKVFERPNTDQAVIKGFRNFINCLAYKQLIKLEGPTETQPAYVPILNKDNTHSDLFFVISDVMERTLPFFRAFGYHVADVEYIVTNYIRYDKEKGEVISIGRGGNPIIELTRDLIALEAAYSMEFKKILDGKKDAEEFIDRTADVSGIRDFSKRYEARVTAFLPYDMRLEALKSKYLEQLAELCGRALDFEKLLVLTHYAEAIGQNPRVVRQHANSHSIYVNVRGVSYYVYDEVGRGGLVREHNGRWVLLGFSGGTGKVQPKSNNGGNGRSRITKHTNLKEGDIVWSQKHGLGMVESTTSLGTNNPQVKVMFISASGDIRHANFKNFALFNPGLSPLFLANKEKEDEEVFRKRLESLSNAPVSAPDLSDDSELIAFHNKVAEKAKGVLGTLRGPEEEFFIDNMRLACISVIKSKRSSLSRKDLMEVDDMINYVNTSRAQRDNGIFDKFSLASSFERMIIWRLLFPSPLSTIPIRNSLFKRTVKKNGRDNVIKGLKEVLDEKGKINDSTINYVTHTITERFVRRYSGNQALIGWIKAYKNRDHLAILEIWIKNAIPIIERILDGEFPEAGIKPRPMVKMELPRENVHILNKNHFDALRIIALSKAVNSDILRYGQSTRKAYNEGLRELGDVPTHDKAMKEAYYSEKFLYLRQLAIKGLLEVVNTQPFKFKLQDAAKAYIDDIKRGDTPVAATISSAKLTHLASHSLVNALIKIAIRDFGASTPSLSSFMQREGDIFWFGGAENRNSNFLDIFIQLAILKANKNNGSKVTRKDEIALIKEMLQNSSVEYVDIDDLKQRLSLQIEHFGVEKGTIYAMKKFKSKKEDILNHASLERAVHLAAIKQMLYDDFETYKMWRGESSARISKEVKGTHKGTSFIIPREPMSYNEFAQKAHEIAEAAYPLSFTASETIPTFGIKEITEEVATAGIVNDIDSTGELTEHQSDALQWILESDLPERKHFTIGHFGTVIAMNGSSAVAKGYQDYDWQDKARSLLEALSPKYLTILDEKYLPTEELKALKHAYLEYKTLISEEYYAFIDSPMTKEKPLNYDKLKRLLEKHFEIPRSFRRVSLERTAFIFSEQATFNLGLIPLLPKVIRSGIQVAVIARTPEQINAIKEFNSMLPQEEKILFDSDVIGAKTKINSHVDINPSNFCYFKLESEEEPDHVISINITKIIIDILGEACNLSDKLIRMLHNAAQKFA